MLQRSWPNRVIQQHQAWRHRYLIYNDPNAAAVSADAVAMRGNALIAGMSWFADPAWHPGQATPASSRDDTPAYQL